MVLVSPLVGALNQVQTFIREQLLVWCKKWLSFNCRQKRSHDQDLRNQKDDTHGQGAVQDLQDGRIVGADQDPGLEVEAQGRERENTDPDHEAEAVTGRKYASSILGWTTREGQQVE